MSQSVTGQETFQNDNLTVQVERQPGCKVVLDVQVSPNAAAASYKKAVKNINKEVSLPGFRKGKAPEATVIRQFGSHIEKEWRQVVVETAFREALDLTGILPYRENVVSRPELKSLSTESGAKVRIQYETLPAIPAIDAKAITLTPVEPKAVTAEDINKTIEDIRFQHAEWTDITDRPAKEGDYVIVDIENIEGETPVPLFEQTRFHIDKEQMGDWMRKLVIGANAGDAVEGKSEKDKSSKSKEFKSTLLRIRIHQIQTAKLPEVNEEFAKKLGLDSTDKLRERVEEELKTHANTDRDEAMREQLDSYLLANYPIDLPASMVEPDVKRTIRHLTDEASKEEAATSVQNSYRLFFLLRKVSDDHHIEVGSQEIMHELMRQMFAVAPDARVIDPKGDPKESRSRIFAYLLQQKARDLLIKEALAK